MKFKFAPKGDYHPQQIITIAGEHFMVAEVAHTGRSLTAVTYKANKHERVLVILTDAPPIKEITA